MYTLTLKKVFMRNGREAEQYVPTTPRGRALYTIDYFLNGKPVLRNHDNARVQLRDGFNC